jgi:hypothetical protein
MGGSPDQAKAPLLEVVLDRRQLGLLLGHPLFNIAERSVGSRDFGLKIGQLRLGGRDLALQIAERRSVGSAALLQLAGKLILGTAQTFSTQR